MENYNKLHVKISSRTTAIVFLTISLLAILIFYFAQGKIRKEYEKRLELPGKLIEMNVTGYEIINNRNFISSLLGEEIIHCVIIGTNGKVYYATSKNLIGKDFWDIKDLNGTVSKKGKNKQKFEKIKENFKYFSKTIPLYNENKDPLGSLYIKIKKENFRKQINKLIYFFLGGTIILLFFIYYFISRLVQGKISKPLMLLLESSKELNKGNLTFNMEKINSNDELEILEEHYLNFVSAMRDKTKFALEIEQKNFNYEYSPLSDKDELGKALVELRNSLKKATEEEIERKETDRINGWITNGVARFSEILRKDVDNFEQLGYNVISNLVEYLDANQGGFFLIEEDEYSNEKNIELKAAFALNRKKHFQKKLAWGEGIIGASIEEGKSSYLTNLPDDYISISSGLGESKPKCLLVVPLIMDKQKYGALELASLSEFEDHQIDFVNRISEIIASTISTVRNTMQTQKLLSETREQSEKIKQTEEELRQNIEEMHATQEEVERANNELRNNEEVLKKQAEELAKEKYLMDALMDNVPEYIYFKDLESKFIKNSKSLSNAFGIDNPKDVIGKSDFDFFDDEHARPAFEDEQNIIKTEKPIIDLVEKEVHDDGKITYVTTTKMPLRDQNGTIVGTFGISKDITAIKELEEETIKKEETLEFEKLLFNTLMDNLDARVTFKDSDAKHIRINKKKKEVLGLKTHHEVVGKTDMEVFGSSHGKEKLEEEIKQIRSGVTLLHIEEFYKQKNGVTGWGDVSRIPIKNSKNEIIGGLIITWDITDKKKATLELETLKKVIEDISNENNMVFYKLNTDFSIKEIKGKGIDLLKLQSKDTQGDFMKTFPNLLKKLKKEKESEKIKHEDEITVDNKKIIVKHVIVKNKNADGEYIGYSLFN